MTRFWPHGLPIAVEVDAQLTPVALTWERVTHPVEHVYRRWRDDVLWWRGRTWREYFVLRTHTGLLVLLYHDMLRDDWRLQRLYD
jgi:hypothetical protein